MRLPTAPLAATAAGLALAWAASAQAGGPSSSGCGCLPTSHQVTIPGVTVIPPTTYLSPPNVVAGAGYGGGGYGQGNLDVQVSTSDSASASTQAVSQGYAASVANSQAANLLAASAAAYGGGGGYVEGGGGVGGSITNLTVVEQGAPAAPQQCVAHASVASLVAIQAVCLDDKAVPHPASQLSPDRDVPLGYEGELFRCVAGSHMQYVTAAWKGAAAFDHGQTVVCGKGEALWRSADGRVQCRPQKAARDCNERSLLRRFGAGIKVVRMAADTCTAYGPGTAVAQSTATSGGDFSMDGGVGR